MITIESALSGGLLFIGRDACYRDLASVHGTYKKVVETLPAIQLIGDYLTNLKIEKAIWYFDSPVSNSGRLKTIFYEQATANNWNWDIHLVHNPDKELINSNSGVIVSSDSMVLDNTKGWANLGAFIVDNCIKTALLVDMNG